MKNQSTKNPGVRSPLTTQFVAVLAKKCLWYFYLEKFVSLDSGQFLCESLFLEKSLQGLSGSHY